ncbi:class I SAM-dependent methyltransferase [Enhygromyxa salina]|nr:class I SAM-dependent methyltransferase [Enhygromyxa salina]
MSSASRRARATLARSGLAFMLLGVSVAIGVSGCNRDVETDKPGDHHYDDKLAALASFEEPERDAWAMPAQVVDALGISPRMDIADIGAGSGYFTRRLATAAPDGTTYAVDVDADFKGYIEAHREQWSTPNIVTRLAVYEHPLLPRDSVDLVFISNTYSFLQDREAYFTAVYKALRSGGRLAVIDWRDDAECPRHVGCPKPSQRVANAIASAELESVGFEVLERHDFLAYQYFMILGRAVDHVKTPPEPTPPDADDAEDAGGSDDL